MISRIEIRAAVAAIRAQRQLVAARNGLQTAVVESWLAAVEAKCDEAVLDEPALRICLRVIERWVSPLSELASAHALLVRLATAGIKPRRGFGSPSAITGWIPPMPASNGGIAATSA
jgi:hypothetical protein